MVGLAVLLFSYGQVWLPNVWYWFAQHNNETYSVDPDPIRQDQTHLITPVSTDFGLVIEKIDVNEKVAPQIDPFNPSIYLPALEKFGVAQAKGSVNPGEMGTTYLFAHSTVNIWEIGRYHAPFTLLDKVNIGDRIVTYYQGQRFDYKVTDRKVVSPQDVHYLSDTPDQPTLILQTCDPPGENTARLLIIAEMNQ